MEIYSWIIWLVSILLLILGIINRKRPWGLKLLYFALGMIAAYMLKDGVRGFIDGANAYINTQK